MLTAHISLEYRFQILSLALTFFFLLKLKSLLMSTSPPHVCNYGTQKYLWTSLLPIISGISSPSNSYFFFNLSFFSFNLNSLFFLEKVIASCKTFSSDSDYLSSLHLLIKSTLFSFSLHLTAVKYIYGWLHYINSRFWEGRMWDVGNNHSKTHSNFLSSL